MDSFKQASILVLVLFITIFTIYSCDTTSSQTYEPITISGKVTDVEHNAMSNAIVRIILPPPERTTTTDEEGKYSFEVEVDSSTTFHIEALKEGYQAKSEEILAIPERDAEMPDFRLISSDSTVERTPDESKGSAYITLESLSHETIQVRETGGTESAEFKFIVTDSSGVPVGNENPVYVHFEIASGPDGGESVYPDSALTRDGLATASLASGTAAGTVQLRAFFIRNGHKMQSKPVGITISGGLPDDDHFEVSTPKRNIPASSSEGTLFTALLGDKYGNTVPEGTAVYFSTTRGVIEGSATTDGEGYASSQLKSNNHSPGSAKVRVETVDENSTRLNRELEVLFTGQPQLSVTPVTLDLENFTSRTFNVTLEDENGNPLSEGTSLKVEMDHPQLTLDGDTLVTLPDTRQSGTGATQFEFRLRNLTDTEVGEDVNIAMITSGPNGNETQYLSFDAPEQPVAEAASIYLESTTRTDIGVQSTGQPEETNLVFQVVDANGNQLTNENSVDVSFRLGSNPGGGVNITDTPVTTDRNGQAVATVISGTTAGVVQVEAEFAMEDGTARSSQPVSIVIHAGSPSQDHLTISSEQRNVALESEEENTITVLVGDKYGNEVRDGTAVYFSTDGGFIRGSAYTVNGRASAPLTVGNPIPAGGIATITASTANEDQQTISASTQIIFSGEPHITVTPETFDIPNADDQTFIYTVTDANGNPMVPGTSITANVEGNEISLLGDVEIIVGEPNAGLSNLTALTEFMFIIDDGDPDTVNDTPVQITIESDGPNGYAKKTLSGRKAKIRP